MKTGAFCCQLPVVGGQEWLNVARNVRQFYVQFEFT